MARLKNGNNNEIILRGQKITLGNLQSIMPKTSALIISRLLYYTFNHKFIVYPDGCNMPYVKRSIREWANDLEIWDDNGNKRKMSKSTVSIVFKKLLQDGLITYINDDSQVRAYAVLERNLASKIGVHTGLKFKELGEWPEDYIDGEDWTDVGHLVDSSWTANPRENQGFRGNFGIDENINKSTYVGNEHQIDKVGTETGQNVDRFGHLVDRSGTDVGHLVDSHWTANPRENQGFRGNFGTGTYTNTYTDTYNKSHKSEERDFSKNTPQRIGAILHGTPGPDAVHNSTTVQDMFKIWQEEFPDSDERLNTRSASWLKAAYDSSFDGDLRAWRNYLRKAKTSEFIMDRPHLLCLRWLLSFETIGNIGRGAYDVTEPALDMAEVAAQQNAMSAELTQQIEALDESEVCKKQRLKILSKIGPFAYKAWFINVSMELDDEQKFKCYGSQFVVDCINTRYRDLLELENEAAVHSEKIVDFRALRQKNCSS